MSFSSDVKEELVRRTSEGRHCRLAELAALTSYAAAVGTDDNTTYITYSSDNIYVIKKAVILIKALFHYDIRLDTANIGKRGTKHRYRAQLRGGEEVDSLLMAIKSDKTFEKGAAINGLLLQKSCCKRAFLRGTFLAAGSVNNPEKSYHFEILCTDQKAANQLVKIAADFDIDMRIARRKDKPLCYIKEADKISQILGVMEAHSALMKIENVQILKDVKNNVNRQVNCETANINKTVNAAIKQLKDIEYIKDNLGMDILSPSLREIAQLRLENPQSSLVELGNMLDPPVGKSGVNHRFRKIAQIAENGLKNS